MAFSSNVKTSGEASPQGTLKPPLSGTLYISETDRLGNERVGILDFAESTAEEAHAPELMESCDRILKAFCNAEGRESPSG